MTDRFNSITVLFEKDIRKDDAQHIIDAIKMIRGVLSIKANIYDVNSCLAEERARMELRMKLHELLK